MKPVLQRFLRACLAASALALLLPVPARAKLVPDAEHTVWIQVETVPAGATVYAPAKESKTLGPLIGRTPCLIAVDISWGRRWMRRRWDRIKVRSPGNVCYATLQPDSSYDLSLVMNIVKEGFREQMVDARVLTLKHPGKGDAGEAAWPERTRFVTELDPLPPAHGTSAAIPAAPPLRRVILADSPADGAAGTLTVHANVDTAHIILNGKAVGTAPLQMVVKEGAHLLEVRKSGYHTLHREILVEDDADVSYRAVLQPIEP